MRKWFIILFLVAGCQEEQVVYQDILIESSESYKNGVMTRREKVTIREGVTTDPNWADKFK